MEYIFITSVSVLALLGLLGWYGRRPFRALPEPIVDKLRTIPMARPRYGQHRVDLVLDDGRVIRGVYVGLGRYPSISPRRLVRRYKASSVIDVRNAGDGEASGNLPSQPSSSIRPG